MKTVRDDDMGEEKIPKERIAKRREIIKNDKDGFDWRRWNEEEKKKKRRALINYDFFI